MSPASEDGDRHRPTLSVLMPSYNSAPFIEEAIRSVLAIEGPDLELVIQDGGSTDGTVELVESIDDPRIRFVSQPDRGQSDALNHALARARGEWVGWLNADDVYRPGQASRLAELLAEPLDFVYGDHAVIDGEGNELKHYGSSRPFTMRELLRHGAFINCMAGFYRAEMLRRIGGWDPELHLCMDYELLLRIRRVAEARHRYLPGDVMALRVHGGGKTQVDTWGIAREGWRAVRPHLSGVRGGWPLALYGQLRFRTYLLTLPLWRTTTWRRLKPAKRL